MVEAKKKAPLEVQLDAYVLPDGHRVYKLFPGRRYRLSKEVDRLNSAFLDIRGLEDLKGAPSSWSDDDLRGVITKDRILDESNKKISKKLTAEDTRRLTFLKALLFEAKKGDLIAIPMGKGLDGLVAIGQFETDAGDIRKVEVVDGDVGFTTYGRPVKWLKHVRRRRFSTTLNKSLHAPTALHLIEDSSREEIYLAAYGSFTYDNIYVASFPSSKESFTTQDQALIGLWFNSVSVVYQRMKDGLPIPDGEDFLELGLEESSIDFELVRNSPLGAVMRTIGPAAFAVLALYPLAAEAAPLQAVRSAQVTAHTVAGAKDTCKVDIPPELALIARGLGQDRWKTTCKVNQQVKAKATVRSTSHLKTGKKGSK